MRLTRASDYALRLMSNLAKEEAEHPLSTRHMAEKIQIPKSFLGNIVQKLSASNLVRTVKGARGGLILGRNPEEISVLDILEAIDGAIQLTHCQQETGCKHSGYCNVKPLMDRISGQLEETLGKTTLRDLIENGSGKEWGGDPDETDVALPGIPGLESLLP